MAMMRTTRLGQHGPGVSRIGLGCTGMSDLYGPADRDESIATLHAALDAGITLLDSGDFYGMGHNDMPIRDALGARRRDRLHEALRAADLQLTPEDLARLEAIVPPNAAAGARYNAVQMAHLDSEMGRQGRKAILQQVT